MPASASTRSVARVAASTSTPVQRILTCSVSDEVNGASEPAQEWLQYSSETGAVSESATSNPRSAQLPPRQQQLWQPLLALGSWCGVVSGYVAGAAEHVGAVSSSSREVREMHAEENEKKENEEEDEKENEAEKQEEQEVQLVPSVAGIFDSRTNKMTC